MTDDIDKIISRIRKCLALSASPEPHEAAAALRQAQKLMQLHGISEDQVRMADVKEKKVPAGRSSYSPPRWLNALATIVCDAFGTYQFYEVHSRATSMYTDVRAGASKFVFVGVGPAPEVASYVFTVLRRKLTAARDKYYDKLSGRRGSPGRTARADAFADGWVAAIDSKVRAFAQATPKIVGQYIKERHPDLATTETISRGRARDGEHRYRGWVEGQEVELQHGVSSEQRRQIGSDT